MSARKPGMPPPAWAPRAPPLPAAAACHSEQPAPRACPRRTSRLFAPTPRVGRFTTRSKRSEEHTSELQSQSNLVCRLLLEKKKKKLAEREPDYVILYSPGNCDIGCISRTV